VNADKAALPSLISRFGYWRMPCAFSPACRDIRGDAAFRHYHFWNRIIRVWAKGSKHPSKHSLRPDQLSRVFPQCGIVILAQQCVVVRHSQEDFVSAVHDRSSRICIPTQCDILSTGCALCSLVLRTLGDPAEMSQICQHPGTADTLYR